MEAIHDPAFEGLGSVDSGLSEAGLIKPVEPMDLGPKKVQAFFYTQAIWRLYNSIGICDFVGIPIGPLKLKPLNDYINAATGWDISLWELLKVGKRTNTMARLFNMREGFTSADDGLPQRMFEPLQNGKLKGEAIDHGEFERACGVYYQMAGWDGGGTPTVAKLAELDLLWANQN